MLTKCALESFYGREDQAMKKEVMVKMNSLMVEFETIKGEVVEEKEGLTWVGRKQKIKSDRIDFFTGFPTSDR